MPPKINFEFISMFKMIINDADFVKEVAYRRSVNLGRLLIILNIQSPIIGQSGEEEKIMEETQRDIRLYTH